MLLIDVRIGDEGDFHHLMKVVKSRPSFLGIDLTFGLATPSLLNLNLANGQHVRVFAFSVS
jgi:hypothetical protein